MSTAMLGFLGWAKQHFTDERLWLLGYQHGHYMSHIVGLKHLLRVLAFVRTKLTVN